MEPEGRRLERVVKFGMTHNGGPITRNFRNFKIPSTINGSVLSNYQGSNGISFQIQ